MASQERFGFKWSIIKEIPDEQYIQFKNWLKKEDLSFFKDKVVFDAGCGIGTNSKIALENGAKEVLSVDAFNDTIDLARKNLEE